MAIVRVRRIFTDCLSVPMIMGIGPISIMPAPFVLAFVFVAEMAIDRKMIMNPRMMNAKPITVRKVQSVIRVRQRKHKEKETIKV